MEKSHSNYSKLPYRKGVGMMILNNEGKVFLGKRLDSKYEAWQMPQGGIDDAETPSKAVKREMFEEIGCDLGEIVAETRRWYSYDIPEFLAGKLWGGKYKGQKQKWFLIKFTGNDSDINIHTHHPEFREWCWADPKDLPQLIVPFKKILYDAVLEEFVPLIPDLLKVQE